MTAGAAEAADNAGPAALETNPLLAEMISQMDAFAPIPLADGRAALEMIRSRSGEWGVDPDRVGASGISAGVVWCSICPCRRIRSCGQPSSARSMRSIREERCRVTRRPRSWRPLGTTLSLSIPFGRRLLGASLAGRGGPPERPGWAWIRPAQAGSAVRRVE